MDEKRYRSAYVTGGAGFIGTKLVPLLRDACGPVTVFDNLHPQVHGERAAPPPDEPGFTFVRGDMRDRAAVVESVAAAAPDLVIHLAAETGTGQSYDEVSRYCEVNVQGTAYLAEALRRLPGGERRRLVLASSRAVYGEGAYRDARGALVVPPPRDAAAMAAGRFVPTDADGTALTPIATPETTPPAPGSVYASTKLMQEYLLAQALADSPIDLVTLRFQNVFGQGQSLRNPYTGVLSIFGGIILEGRTLDIFEDGDIVRDFIHVADVVRAIMAAATVEAPPVVPINIGTGGGITILEAARVLLRCLERPENALEITGRFRIGDIRHARADIGRARDLLGWEPQIPVEHGIAELAQWIAATRS